MRSELAGTAKPHAIVVGAGVAGLASALALSRREFSVEVLEARTQSRTAAFRGELLHPRGAEMLRSWGARPDARDEILPCRGLVIRCESSRDEVLLDYRAGTTGLIARHDVWLSVLERPLAQSPAVQITYGSSVQEVVVDRGRAESVRLRSDDRMAADLIVIATGRSLRLATKADVSVTRRVTSRSLVLTLTDVELPHPERGHLFLGGPGPVLAYTIGAGCVRMCIDLPLGQLNGTDGIDLPSTLGCHLPAGLMSALIDQDWRVDAREYPNVSMRATHRWPESLAIVGDAATCSHPLTASGMTRAFQQAEALAQRAGAPHVTRPTWRRTSPASSSARSAVVADALERVCAGADPAGPVLREALFRYLRRPRRRRVALELASAEKVSPLTAALEYGALMLQAGRPLVHPRADLSGRRRVICWHLLRSAARLVRELVRR
jgi:squalene monooxygenase